MSRVFNRPMFNKDNSAYGRGITANLVTEEQRQRYNAGGRVGLWGGAALGTAGKILPWAGKQWGRIKWPTGKFRIPGVTGTGSIPGKYQPAPYTMKEMAKNPSILWKGIKENPWWAGAGGVGLFSDPVAAVTKGVAEAVPATLKWGAEALTPGRFEKHLPWVKDKGEANKDLINKLTVEDVTTLKEDPKKGEVQETETLDWTDQERKEKIGQMQLKMAQRLVGGARDKWGSKAQMKNLGDAFGDIAAIGDKTELRKDSRKYKAMGKMYQDVARDKVAMAKEYGNQIASGASESQALKVSTNGKLNAVQVPRDEKLRKKVFKTIGSGDIYFDEAIGSFAIRGFEDEEGAAIPIPREKLEIAQAEFLKQGA